jgi:hypothetical protein
MKNAVIIITIFIFLFSAKVSLFGQNNDTWHSFWNNDTTLFGYKDKNGIVKIEPKFDAGFAYVFANKFDHIIVVTEKIDEEEFLSYFLTKTGKKVRIQNDIFPTRDGDCESEGFIRFRDSKTSNTGMFNRNGDIVIPAEYSFLENVRNGMIIAIKDAEMIFHEEEYQGWRGGTEILIDTLNNILINDFSNANKLNLFSLEKTKNLHSDSIRDSFLATDDYFYSFINFEKEFKQWFFDDLLVGLTVEKLLNVSFDSIIHWTLNSGYDWIRNSKEQFITDNFDILTKDLFRTLNPNYEYEIAMNWRSPFMYQGVEFEKYNNNCNMPKYWIYPMMHVVIRNKDENSLPRFHNSYGFLRTENGYKLIEISSEDLK